MMGDNQKDAKENGVQKQATLLDVKPEPCPANKK